MEHIYNSPEAPQKGIYLFPNITKELWSTPFIPQAVWGSSKAGYNGETERTAPESQYILHWKEKWTKRDWEPFMKEKCDLSIYLLLFHWFLDLSFCFFISKSDGRVFAISTDSSSILYLSNCLLRRVPCWYPHAPREYSQAHTLQIWPWNISNVWTIYLWKYPLVLLGYLAISRLTPYIL